MTGFQRFEWACANAYILFHGGKRILLWINGRRNARNVKSMTLDELYALIESKRKEQR